MIYRYTIKKIDHDFYEVAEHVLSTADHLREMGDDLMSDGLYSDALWYYARAREAGNGTIWDFCSSGTTRYPLEELPAKARRRLPPGWTRALEKGHTVIVYSCREGLAE